MPRHKTITDDEIITVARTLFLKNGINASTRDIAKAAGISEAIIYQRFGTKENFFFAAMKLPETELDAMPVFLTIISHPSFSMPAFLRQHDIPAIQLREKLIDYLVEESKIGRVSQNNLVTAVDV
jgi:AcrR family transcriptional regulator